jgi:hypothetical protein
MQLASVPAALQTQFTTAIAGVTSPLSAKAAFGGDAVSAAVGAILDALPAWRSAVQAAVASYAASIAPYGDPETWTH